MPLIKIQTNLSAMSQTACLELEAKLSAILAEVLNKSEAYVMTVIEPEAQISFGGSRDPASYVEIKNIGVMTSEQTDRMSQRVSQAIEYFLKVSSSRIYIEYTDAQRHLWAWNGSTFASQ